MKIFPFCRERQYLNALKAQNNTVIGSVATPLLGKCFRCGLLLENVGTADWWQYFVKVTLLLCFASFLYLYYSTWGFARLFIILVHIHIFYICSNIYLHQESIKVREGVYSIGTRAALISLKLFLSDRQSSNNN